MTLSPPFLEAGPIGTSQFSVFQVSHSLSLCFFFSQHTDMPEEMRVETMELCVTACEKFASNNEVCVCLCDWNAVKDRPSAFV